MKKLILMLLVLAGGVVNVSARSLSLRGDFDGWSSGLSFSETDGVYTTTLTSAAKTVIFKLVDNTENENWLGYNQFNLNYHSSWSITAAGEDGSDLVFDREGTGFTEFIFTATYSDSKWTLRIDPVGEKQTYTIQFINGNNWTNVYAYTFDLEESGSWPGTELKTPSSSITINGNTYDVYTYAFQSVMCPTHIIFNNNNNTKTEDIDMINNKLYSICVRDRYAVVGDEGLFSSGWNILGTTDFMALSEGTTYTYTMNNVALTAKTYKYKVIDRNSNAVNPTWIPDGSGTDKELTISTAGIYNVTFTFNSSNNEITAVAEKIPATVTVNAGTEGYATFSCAYPLDFTGVTDVKAYRAESVGTSKVNFTRVSGKVPANTGLFISGTSYDVPTTATPSAIGTNLLKPTTGSDIYDSSGSKSQYVFAKQNGDLGFYKVGSTLSPATGKAYLETTASDARLSFVFDDEEVSGINTVKATTAGAEGYYNLAGQRVASPTKGLYIVNGKKVIIK